MALTRITKGVIKPNENYQAGIVTATGLDVNGNGDISGDLNVGGILTYEDVTSIDAVGIITAQQGIHVGAGVSAVGVGTFSGLDISGDIDVDGHTNLDNVSVAGVSTFSDDVTLTGASGNIVFDKSDNSLNIRDGAALKFGDGNDLIISHGAAAHGHVTFIDEAGAGRLRIRTNDFVEIGKLASAEKSARFFVDGAVELYHDDVKRLETSAKGIQVGTGVTIETNGQATFTGIVTASSLSLDAVPGTNTNAQMPVLFQTTSGTIDGGSQLTYDPGGDVLRVNGLRLAQNEVRATGNGPLLLTTSNGNGNVDINVRNTHVEINGNLLPATDSTDNLGSNTVRWANLYADTLYGDGSNLTGITQTTINNNTNNYLITGTGTANTLQGESGLTWDGATLSATGSDAQLRLYDSTASSENSAFRLMAYNGVNFIQSGKAFSSDSKADLIFGSMFGGTEWARITTDGYLGIGEVSPGVKLHVKGTGELLRLETTASGGGQCYIDFDDETATRASIGLRGSSSDTLTLAALNGSMSFDVQNKTQAVNIDTAGRLLVNTTSSSISSSELFEVKSTSSGFSHFRNNHSGYAPIYIDNEYTNTAMAPLITITDGGGNRAGLLLDPNSVFDITGQGAVTFSTGGTVGNATERVRINSNGLSVGNSTNTSALCINNLRSTASAPTFNEANADGFLVDVYNTGNPYPRYVSLAARGYASTSAEMSFWTDPGSNPQKRMTIAPGGNVGIGEDDPQTKLNVRGCISTGRNVAREVGTIIDISSSYSGSRNGVQVINGQKNYEENSNADWITANGQRVNANLTIDLGSQYTCDRFVIYNQNEYTNNVREVKHFTLEGSNDKSSWTTLLDDECGASYAHEPNPGFSFRIPSDFTDDDEGATFRYWRFTMKDYHGSTTLGGVMELELYEVDSSNKTISEVSTHHLSAMDITAQNIYHDLPCFYVAKAGSQSTSNQTWTVIQLTDDNSGAFDTSGEWDNSSYRFTPTIPGYYHFNFNLSISHGSLQASYIAIYKNGSVFTQTGRYFLSGDNYDDATMNTSAVIHLDGQSDYVDFRGWRYGGNQNMGGSSAFCQASGFLVRHAGYRRHGDGV